MTNCITKGCESTTETCDQLLLTPEHKWCCRHTARDDLCKGCESAKRKCVICGFGLCDKMEINQTFDYCCWDVPEEYIHVTPREYFCKYCTEFSS